MSKDLHTQCLLRKYVNQQIHEQVTWIPTKFAVIEKTIKLSDDKDDWTVIKVGKTLESNEANLRSRDFKNQRKVSDKIRNSKREKVSV
jgi:hypothetical protein